VDITAVGAFWLVALLLIIAPGADWAFTLGAAMRGNAVGSAVGGLVAGYAVMTLVVAAGLGSLIAGSGAALTAITLVGGAYLVWLGIGTLRHPERPLPAGDAAPRSTRGTFAEGIGASGLNPKGLLILLAVLPQFTNPKAAWPMAAQMVVLGMAFIATCAVFYLALGSFARGMLHARPSAASALRRLSGAGMIVIGALLVVQRVIEGVRDALCVLTLTGTRP
jgi:threonine/homoserine/homoserine lactone efflux protein